MLFFPDTFRNPLLFLSLSPLFFITCAFPHLVTSCLSVIHPVFPHRLLYLTLYLPTPSIFLASILFQFTLIYLPGCCINSAATVWEYITEEKKKGRASECLLNLHLCACAGFVYDSVSVNEGSESMHIHLLSFSTHPVLLHLVPPSVPPILPIKKPPQSLPVEDE